MNHSDKEYYLYRILSGCIRCRIYDNFGKLQTFILKKPTTYQRYIAEELYQEYLVQFKLEGLHSEEEFIGHLIRTNNWSEEEEGKLKDLNKNIENLKTKLYRLIFKSKEKKLIKEALLISKTERDRLLEKKNYYSYLTYSGAAALVKMRYLIGATLYKENGSKVFDDDENLWLSSDGIIDSVVTFCNKNRISEKALREIARTEPWRSTWLTRKASGEQIFDFPSSEFSDEQKVLIYWTCLYDSVYESQDTPMEEIIEDDDALDGWLLDQEKQRKRRVTEKNVEDMIPEKMKNANEIFLPANTIEDAKKIEELNDEQGKAIKNRRDRAITNKGYVSEANLPDVKANIAMEQVKKAKDAILNKTKG